jgi:hypothetical protein
MRDLNPACDISRSGSSRISSVRWPHAWSARLAHMRPRVQSAAPATRHPLGASRRAALVGTGIVVIFGALATARMVRRVGVGLPAWDDVSLRAWLSGLQFGLAFLGLGLAIDWLAPRAARWSAHAAAYAMIGTFWVIVRTLSPLGPRPVIPWADVALGAPAFVGACAGLGALSFWVSRRWPRRAQPSSASASRPAT